MDIVDVEDARITVVHKKPLNYKEPSALLLYLWIFDSFMENINTTNPGKTHKDSEVFFLSLE